MTMQNDNVDLEIQARLQYAKTAFNWGLLIGSISAMGIVAVAASAAQIIAGWVL